ncbi:acetyl-CoA carboxylase, carboxyltransferase subunit beta [Aerococcaceae bacterium DSM 111021]|nr:acetyl-CoA carboxylase, carboxyltransferase subunit beta [Aerococcaceae bacterium DSM 111021]
MALFRRKKTIRINPISPAEVATQRSSIPDNIAEQCPHCNRIILQNQITEDYCCPHCSEHLHFPAYERINWLVDEGSFVEWDSDIESDNPLNFPGYSDKLEKSKKMTQLKEAVVTGRATLDGVKISIGVMDKRFVMASMGTVVGEKITRLFEHATEEKLPVILYIASGGARMHEGILSLMQMAKISQVVAKHQEAGLFYCAVLTHPTTGGVTASFAMQGDITLAEPRAIVGFAGKRVIEQTIKSKLTKDFQQAEWVFDNGFIDSIVPRASQRQIISQLVQAHSFESGV